MDDYAMKEVTVSFLGFGSMARSLAQAFSRNRLIKPENILGTVRDPNKVVTFQKEMAYRFTTNNVDAVLNSEVIIISVRPQQAKSLLAEIGAHIDHDKTVVSLMAGVPLLAIARYLHNKPTLVHVHPTSLAFSKSALGVSFLVADLQVPENKIQLVTRLFLTVGEVRPASEDVLNKYVILAGCAPAYLSLFLYYISQIGAEIGIPIAESSEIEALMMSGIREVIVNEEVSPQTIISRIATPQGVTIEGLKVLESEPTKLIIRRAVEASLRKLDLLKTVLD